MVPQIVGRDPGDYARNLQSYLESLDQVLTAVNVILGAFVGRAGGRRRTVEPVAQRQHQRRHLPAHGRLMPPERLKSPRQALPPANVLTSIYTVPPNTECVLSTIQICNQGVRGTFRISIAVAGAPDDPKQYLYFDEPIDAHRAFAVTLGITMGEDDQLRVSVLQRSDGVQCESGGDLVAHGQAPRPIESTDGSTISIDTLAGGEVLWLSVIPGFRSY